MKNLSPDICHQISKARREQGLSQSALAMEMGCKQPALSAFEGGDGTKLSEEVVQKIAKRLGVSLELKEGAQTASDVPLQGMTDGLGLHGFCPSGHCPSNVPYLVEDRVFMRPARHLAAPVGGARRCAVCGEVLEWRCPTCGAPLNDGACCAVCGSSYVVVSLPPDADKALWVRTRREEIKIWRQLI